MHQYWSNLSLDGDISADVFDGLKDQLEGEVTVEMAEQRRQMHADQHVKIYHWTG